MIFWLKTKKSNTNKSKELKMFSNDYILKVLKCLIKEFYLKFS